MNKTELVAAVAEKAGITKKEAERVVNATVDTIVASLVKGDKVINSVFFCTFDRYWFEHSGLYKRKKRKRDRHCVPRQSLLV